MLSEPELVIAEFELVLFKFEYFPNILSIVQNYEHSLWRSSVCCLLLLLAGILFAGIGNMNFNIFVFFYEFSLFYRHKVRLYFSATLHNKTKIWRMFEAIGSSEEDEIIERIVWYWCWGRMLHKKHSSPS